MSYDLISKDYGSIFWDFLKFLFSVYKFSTKAFINVAVNLNLHIPSSRVHSISPFSERFSGQD